MNSEFRARSDIGTYQQAMLEEKILQIEQEVKLQQLKQLIMARDMGLRDAVQMRSQVFDSMPLA